MLDEAFVQPMALNRNQKQRRKKKHAGQHQIKLPVDPTNYPRLYRAVLRFENVGPCRAHPTVSHTETDWLVHFRDFPSTQQRKRWKKGSIGCFSEAFSYLRLWRMWFRVGLERRTLSCFVLLTMSGEIFLTFVDFLTDLGWKVECWVGNDII